MIKTIEGIIIKSIPYSETSKIITVYSKEHGKIGLMAKGVKKMTSKLRSSVGLFTYGKFYIYYKETGLSTLTQVDVYDGHLALGHDLEQHAYATIVAEYADKAGVDDVLHETLFHLVVDAIKKIEDGADPEVILFIFELKIASMMGFGLNLNECVLCGSTKNIVTISTSFGGLVCQNCNRDSQMTLDGRYIQLLRQLNNIEFNQLNKVTLKNKTKKVLRQIIDEYFDLHSGLYLKSKKYLKELKKLSFK